MIDLKLSKKAKTETMPSPIGGKDGPDYPYGTRLTFDEEQVAKSEYLKSVDDQQTVSIKAVGKVVSVRSESRDGKPHRSVEIQIEKIDFESGDEAENESGFDEASKKS